MAGQSDAISEAFKVLQAHNLSLFEKYASQFSAIDTGRFDAFASAIPSTTALANDAARKIAAQYSTAHVAKMVSSAQGAVISSMLSDMAEVGALADSYRMALVRSDALSAVSSRMGIAGMFDDASIAAVASGFRNGTIDSNEFSALVDDAQGLVVEAEEEFSSTELPEASPLAVYTPREIARAIVLLNLACTFMVLWIGTGLTPVGALSAGLLSLTAPNGQQFVKMFFDEDDAFKLEG